MKGVLVVPRKGKRLETCKAAHASWGGKLLFVLYVGMMLYLLFLQRSPYRGPLSYKEYLEAFSSLVPFDTVHRMIWAAQHGSSSLIAFAWRNLLGNVVLFWPLGIFLPMIWVIQRRWWACLLTVALLIFCVECAQLFTTRGSADVDDLILNTLGAMMGYIGWRMFTRKRAKE